MGAVVTIRRSRDPVIESLIQTHGDRVLALLQRLLGDSEEARDAYQETWCSIWQALPRLRPSSDPWPYIRQAAVRKAIDRFRVAGSAPRQTVQLEEELLAPAQAEDRAATIDLSALEPRQRACLTLFFWEGCSVREIARQLEVPEGTVKTWMFRGRSALRAQLEKKGELG